MHQDQSKKEYKSPLILKFLPPFPKSRGKLNLTRTILRRA
jgi:hypothetical protein